MEEERVRMATEMDGVAKTIAMVKRQKRKAVAKLKSFKTKIVSNPLIKLPS